MVHWTLALTQALPLRPHTQGPTVCMHWAYTHMLFSLRVWDCANKGSLVTNSVEELSSGVERGSSFRWSIWMTIWNSLWRQETMPLGNLITNSLPTTFNHSLTENNTSCPVFAARHKSQTERKEENKEKGLALEMLSFSSKLSEL
ncbi:hypothetical protein EYF80_001552 [Liparis tanakae]|uniref:Uncharacterized protein n=1 Tax=Liparis tanakae TaxID=230148 RepID=A0A4Z2JDL9_9TELE|nr:hypothetical protein EYF80_001552 [Liparis tanakae]